LRNAKQEVDDQGNSRLKIAYEQDVRKTTPAYGHLPFQTEEVAPITNCTKRQALHFKFENPAVAYFRCKPLMVTAKFAQGVLLPSETGGARRPGWFSLHLVHTLFLSAKFLGHQPPVSHFATLQTGSTRVFFTSQACKMLAPRGASILFIGIVKMTWGIITLCSCKI